MAKWVSTSSNSWRAAVDIRGSALPSAAKNNKGHKVFVCMLGVGGLSRGCGRSAFIFLVVSCHYMLNIRQLTP